MIIHFPTWHEQLLESKHFLDEFIEQVEKTIASLQNSYETERETVNDVSIDEDYSSQTIYPIEYFRGFDDYTYNVEELFTIYFPNLHRRSALITLYSFLEFELNKLCEELKDKNDLELSLKDLKGDGIERASSYLRKVIKLSWDNSRGVWSEIKKIQNIRNKIVHHDGKINIKEIDEDFLNYIVDSEHLLGDKGKENLITEIVIKEGFLSYVVEKFYELFGEINEVLPT